MPTILMRCPKCGKHFEVERTSEHVQVRDEVEPVEKGSGTWGALGPVYIPGSVADLDESTESEEAPVEIVTRDETFRCKHCGYTWSKSRTQVKR